MKPLLSRGFTRFQTRNFGLVAQVGIQGVVGLGPRLNAGATLASQVTTGEPSSMLPTTSGERLQMRIT
jgi:hypothetical protein